MQQFWPKGINGTIFSAQNFVSTNSHDPIQELNLLRPTLLSRTGQKVIVENLAFV